MLTTNHSTGQDMHILVGDREEALRDIYLQSQSTLAQQEHGSTCLKLSFLVVSEHLLYFEGQVANSSKLPNARYGSLAS